MEKTKKTVCKFCEDYKKFSEENKIKDKQNGHHTYLRVAMLEQTFKDHVMTSQYIHPKVKLTFCPCCGKQLVGSTKKPIKKSPVKKITTKKSAAWSITKKKTTKK